VLHTPQNPPNVSPVSQVSPGLPDLSAADDLALRWSRARCAALRTVVTDADTATEEPELARKAAALDPAAALSRVFEYSRILGLGFCRTYGVDLTLVDLAELIPALGAPCHPNGFTAIAQEAASRSTATRCAAAHDAAAHGEPLPCDHWRESIHGLVNGLSSSVSYTRVGSHAGGASACADLLHVAPQTPLRFTPLPAEMHTEIAAIRTLIERVDPGVKLEIFGLIDGVLHYRLDPGPGANRDTCGSKTKGCGLDSGAVLQGALHRRFPTLRVADASPRAVFSG
jgi:hypothetical protein